jgi:drug/metabolite transporter (DMT)-like permease
VGELLGLAVACGFGSADFLGGLASRRSPVVVTVFVQQMSGLVLGLFVVLLASARWPAARDAGLSAGAGVGAMVGVAYLYRGLALGRMSVVAPLSAAGSAVLEVAWGVGRGERPGVAVVAGGGLVLVAVAVIAGGPGDRHREVGLAHELVFSAGAALGFAASFICFAETSSHSGFWPVVVARCTSVPILAVALLVTERRFVPDRRDLPCVVGAGWLDAGANVVLLLAVRHDLLSVVAPLAALYPAATVVLARLVLHEQITRRRAVGLALALLGLTLIAAR